LNETKTRLTAEVYDHTHLAPLWIDPRSQQFVHLARSMDRNANGLCHGQLDRSHGLYLLDALPRMRRRMVLPGSIDATPHTRPLHIKRAGGMDFALHRGRKIHRTLQHLFCHHGNLRAFRKRPEKARSAILSCWNDRLLCPLHRSESARFSTLPAPARPCRHDGCHSPFACFLRVLRGRRRSGKRLEIRHHAFVMACGLHAGCLFCHRIEIAGSSSSFDAIHSQSPETEPFERHWKKTKQEKRKAFWRKRRRRTRSAADLFQRKRPFIHEKQKPFCNAKQKKKSSSSSSSSSSFVNDDDRPTAGPLFGCDRKRSLEPFPFDTNTKPSIRYHFKHMKRDQTQKRPYASTLAAGSFKRSSNLLCLFIALKRKTLFLFFFFFFNLEKNLPFRMCVPYEKEHERAFLLLPS